MNSWSQLQWPGNLQQVVQEVWCVWLLLINSEPVLHLCSLGGCWFEVLIHGSVARCGQWGAPVTEALIHLHPLGLWTEEIQGVGFLYLLNFNSWQWGSTFALQFNIIDQHLCLWSWQ